MKNKKLIIIAVISTLLIVATLVIYKATTKNNSIEALSTKIESLKDLESTYKIENTEEYNKLLTTAKDALKSEDLDKITNIESELIKFEEKLLNLNTENLNSIIADIKKIDVSKLKSKTTFETSLKIIEDLQTKKDFKFAIEKAIALKESIEKEKTTFDALEKKKAEATAKEKAKKEEQKKQQEGFTPLAAILILNTPDNSLTKNDLKPYGNLSWATYLPTGEIDTIFEVRPAETSHSYYVLRRNGANYENGGTGLVDEHIVYKNGTFQMTR